MDRRQFILTTGATVLAGTVVSTLEAAAPPDRLKALAALCADTCRDCERACKPQAAKHPECKACMDDAAECAKACNAYKAA